MSPEQFRHWSRLLSEATLLVARDGRVLAANGGVESLGLDREGLVGRRLSEVATSSEESLLQFLRLCFRVTEPLVGSIVLRRADGETVACEARGMLADRKPRPPSERTALLRLSPKTESTRRYALLEEKISQLNTQIRRRVELERELKERNEYLQVTLTSIGDGVIVTDAEARITLLNPLAEELTGWTSEEAMGQPLLDVFRIVNETNRKPVENPVFKALRERIVVGLANHTLLLAKDGTERPIDDSAAAILDGRGAVLGAVLVFRDITERRKAQAELSRQTHLFSQLADAIPQLAWMARPDGYVEWYNNRWYEYTGAAPEEVLGEGWRSLHDPDVLPAVMKRWRASLESGEPFSMVFPLRGADGLFRPFLTRVMPLRDASGRIVRWFGTNTDISEQKQLEEELRRVAGRLKDSNRRKDEFLAMLAHELRNPLAPIRAGLELLKTADDAIQREEMRAVMERQLGQLVTLIDDLLDVSRITRGKLELRKRPVKLADILSSAVEASKPLIDQAGHRLVGPDGVDEIWIEADPNRLAQVFANLLNNAAKYSPPGSSIVLATERREDRAVVSVRDEGIGIPQERLAEIFEMFVQIEPPPELSHPGLGIGLTLVKTLTELHGGSVEARSDGAGRGSAFSVSLPMLRAQPPPAEAQARAAAEPAGARRVLVVDDNAAAARMLSLLVKVGGHEVQTAFDGLEALAVADEFRPEIVIMDLGMPRLGGCEAAQQMRRMPWGKGVLLVAVTGWGQDEDRRRSREAGFDLHFVKPIDPAALEAVLSRPLPAAD